MKWHENALLIVLILAAVIIIFSLERCNLQHTCLQDWSNSNGPGRSAKECGL